MRIKKLLTSILVLAIILLGVFNSNITKAEEMSEEKVYCNATIEDNFVDNTILIILTNEESLKFKKYDVDDFSNIDCIEVIDMTADTANKIIEQQMSNYRNVNNEDIIIDASKYNKILKLELSNSNKNKVISSIKILEEYDWILSAQPDFLIKQENKDVLTKSVVNNRSLSNDWAYDLMKIEEAWGISRGSSSVKIGIIDTGIYGNHPALVGRIDTNLSYDFTGNNNPLVDTRGHGTEMAGIMVANEIANGQMRGITENVKVVSLKVSNDANFRTSISRIASAILYANVNNIKIINMSLELDSSNNSQEDLMPIEEALEQYGGLAVCSAGNNYREYNAYPIYPAAFTFNNVIAVAASNSQDVRMGMSNYCSTHIDLFAPGEDIITTTKEGGYDSFDGTSPAAAMVSAVAALVLSKCPSVSTLQLRNLILNNVDVSIGFSTLCTTSGRINAYKTLSAMTTYLRYSETQHTERCACGSTTLASHVVRQSEIINGYAKCIYCNYNVNLGNGFVVVIPNSISNLNDSYTLPNGIIILLE